MKELFQDLIVEIAFKISGLETPILIAKETEINKDLREIKGSN